MFEFDGGEVAVESSGDSFLNQLFDHALLFVVAHGFEFDFTGGAADNRMQVGDTGRGRPLTQPDGPAQRVTQDILVVADGYTGAHTAALADVRAAAGFVGNFRDDLLHERRDNQFNPLGLELHGFLVDDGDFVFDCARVVGPNFAAEAVFQRRHDTPPVGVVLRVG